jgi:hypothetical protein
MPWRRYYRREGYRREGGRSTNPPTEATLFIAVILWLIGVASTILGVIHLPGSWGLWSLALAGLLLILGSVIYGL